MCLHNMPTFEGSWFSELLVSKCKLFSLVRSPQPFAGLQHGAMLGGEHRMGLARDPILCFRSSQLLDAHLRFPNSGL